MGLKVLFCSELRIFPAMGLAFLPWIAAVLYTAGWWAALNFLGYAIVVFAIGYGIVSMALPASPEPRSFFSLRRSAFWRSRLSPRSGSGLGWH